MARTRRIVLPPNWVRTQNAPDSFAPLGRAAWVLASTSSFYSSDKHVQPLDIPESVGATTELDGNARTSGKTVRVAAQLVRGSDDVIVLVRNR